MSLDDFSLFTHFQRQFRARADDELLVTSDGAPYTYRDIDRSSARIASCLRELGVEAGDRVSVQVEKSPASLCLYLACLRSGFVFHPLNMAYKAKELDYFLTDSAPAVVVCDPRNEPTFSALARSSGARAVLTMNADGGGSLAERAQRAAEELDTVPRRKDDLAALLYSSGTTGVPKGVMLTHGNLRSNTEALVACWEFAPGDRLLHALPMYHVHGLFVAIGCVLSSGASMRWLTTYTVREVLEYLPECTVMMGVPTHYTRLLADPDFSRTVTRNVRLFISGSAPLLPETFAEFTARTGHRILERYGMTETNINTANPLHGERKAGTVGLPIPGVEVRITDDRDASLEPGRIGNLEVRGPNVFIGYWGLPEKTAKDFTKDGFFDTGDTGVIDDDGYLSIVGRTKDVVITGGLNVYPREVEALIDELPGVKESAVIGVPHPDFGEGVVAVVVARRGTIVTEGEIIEACKAQLAGFKVPKRVVLVDQLPRNAMSKVQKNALRDACRDLFARSVPDAPR